MFAVAVCLFLISRVGCFCLFVCLFVVGGFCICGFVVVGLGCAGGGGGGRSTQTWEGSTWSSIARKTIHIRLSTYTGDGRMLCRDFVKSAFRVVWFGERYFWWFGFLALRGRDREGGDGGRGIGNFAETLRGRELCPSMRPLEKRRCAGQDVRQSFKGNAKRALRNCQAKKMFNNIPNFEI